MSISSLYTNLNPTLVVDPRNSRRLDPRFTFSRASSTTYVNRQKVLTTAKANEPFVEWDPATGSCLGLRLWGAVTNLLLQSNTFNTTWTQNNVTITPNATASIDGGTNGSTLLINSAGAALAQTSQSFAAGSTLTVSIFAKKNASNFLRFELDNVVSCWFNLNTGATGTNQAGSGNVLFSAKSIEQWPNGWYRCSLTVTTTTITTIGVNVFATNADGTSSSVNSSIYIFGAQLQTGSTLGPYVPTGAATVSTSAATLSLTGTEFARIWNTGGLGIYAEVIAAQASNGSNQFIARASDGSYNNAMALNVTGSGFLQSAITANGTLYSISSSSALVSGNVIKTATRINTNDLSLAHVNSTFTNNVVTLPTSLNRLDIGADHLGLNAMVGMYLRRLCVYPRGLTNSQMLQLIRG